jgi:hypothetical protein
LLGVAVTVIVGDSYGEAVSRALDLVVVDFGMRPVIRTVCNYVARDHTSYGQAHDPAGRFLLTDVGAHDLISLFGIVEDRGAS